MLKKLLVAAGTVLFASQLLAADAKHPQVELDTSFGAVVVELDGEKAPISTANFLAYVDKGFYNGTIFHRVIPGFMVQGGGFTPQLVEKPTNPPIKNEADNGLHNTRGTLAMARTSDVNSATSQFFINHKDNNFLDHGGRDFGYAVFGKVVKGMEVVDQIAAVQTSTQQGQQNVPVDPVLIKVAKRLP
ncbi:peptidylprolyl isomerase [Pseudomonas sp. HR96]|uniref:peptidylprolyl isomerase n=1 Tax=Pseudomonas sp. HR96 TaxID=1027966 RepID=UPI002A754503|nr:peptidylprolyl isomerase [Pseudomonas sp. HR96]WPP01190.1 peptidylprolyl isomerase [Pseudomonas sp. HR96]